MKKHPLNPEAPEIDAGLDGQDHTFSQGWATAVTWRDAIAEPRPFMDIHAEAMPQAVTDRVAIPGVPEVVKRAAVGSPVDCSLFTVDCSLLTCL